MPPTESLLALARRPLLVALGLVLGGTLAAWGAHERYLTAVVRAADAAAQKDQALAELAEAQDARDRLEANLRQYEALRTGGFVGRPDRVALVEALEAAARDMAGVPLRWELDVAEPVETLHDPKHGQPIAQAYRIPMRIAADHVHEQEWVDLLARLRQAGQGQLRVEACGFRAAPWQRDTVQVPAVGAQCALAWVFLAPEAPAAPEAAR